MPSIVATSYNPYEPAVLSVPSAMSAITDMWGRQESDILMQDGLKKKLPYNTLIAENVMEVEAAAEEDIAASPELHTIRVQLHNPYSLTNPMTDVYVCPCEQCQGTMCAEQLTLPEELVECMPQSVLEQQPIITSQFMPPPPPRVDTYDVISACGCEEADAVVYNMMVRWYTRVSVSSPYFQPDEPCPPPNPETYTFAEWCEMVNTWWYRNFEHRQKKPAAVTPRSRNTYNQLW